uniref:Uncharacterized protein n=1 Tax=Strigamia maritima TaxID=126957 RepID=T1JKR1_STRMM
MHILDFLIRKI